PLILYFSWSSAHPHLHPFPPRRSSDLSVSRASPRMVFTTRDRRWVKLSSMRGVSLTLAGSRRASGTPGRSPRDGPAGRTGPGRPGGRNQTMGSMSSGIVFHALAAVAYACLGGWLWRALARGAAVAGTVRAGRGGRAAALVLQGVGLHRRMLSGPYLHLG